MKIGILSFAHLHAASYVHCLRQLPGVELVGIADDDVQRGRQAATDYETTYYANAEELLEQKLDGVIITSENATHRRWAELAAPRVRAILCEKPLASTVEDAQAIIQVCQEHGVMLQTAFPVRFAPPIQRLKKMMDGEELGRVYAAKTTNHGAMPGGWFSDPNLAGGGAVMDHTVHVIDILRWLWNTEVTQVYAEVAEDLLHPDRGIDDVGMLSFRLANGVFGTLDTSWSRPQSYPTWGDVTIALLCEQGAVEVDTLAQDIDLYSDAIGKARWVPWGSDMDLGLIRNFVEMIREDRLPFISGEDGLRALEVAMAAYESARMGAPVTLSRKT